MESDWKDKKALAAAAVWKDARPAKARDGDEKAAA